MNPIYLTDFYKVGHIDQYPEGTQQVVSNLTPRTTRMPEVKKVYHVGLQRFMLKYLVQAFREEFFALPIDQVIADYKRVISATLGVADPRTDHIAALHRYQYLPLKIWSLPEGTGVPIGFPSMVWTNTKDDMFWLPNYIETLLSCMLWKPSTSATIARQYRSCFEHYARLAGEDDLGFIDWQGHDFSFRGMSGLEDAVLSGMGHLLSFSGTDTLPAILEAAEYYSADLTIGGSVPATEHSVMTAGGNEAGQEYGTIRRLITEVYPRGIVSIVSDTWDLWKVLTEYVPDLAKEILARDGKIVIRPDSGDPVLIVCGNPHIYEKKHAYRTRQHPAIAGTLRLLQSALGVDERPGKLPMIRKGGGIYGDSITLRRANDMSSQIVRKLKLSPYNMVYGIGSYTYEYQTRDVFGFAIKATAKRANGEWVAMQKDPITDLGGKKSHYGIPRVIKKSGQLVLEENVPLKALDQNDCAFEVVFEDSTIYNPTTFKDMRKRVRDDAVPYTEPD